MKHLKLFALAVICLLACSCASNEKYSAVSAAIEICKNNSIDPASFNVENVEVSERKVYASWSFDTVFYLNGMQIMSTFEAPVYGGYSEWCQNSYGDWILYYPEYVKCDSLEIYITGRESYTYHCITVYYTVNYPDGTPDDYMDVFITDDLNSTNVYKYGNLSGDYTYSESLYNSYQLDSVTLVKNLHTPGYEEDPEVSCE